MPNIIQFKPQFPWYGGDLQTLRNTILRDKGDLSAWKSKKLEFQMQDDTGDRLVATLNITNQSPAQSTLIILIHGMSGCEDSFTMRKTAQFFLGLGYSTLRINLRGAGYYRSLAKETYHSGRSGDLNTILEELPPNLAQNIFLIGHSLGASMLIKAMSELDVQYKSSLPVIGAATLCAPLDLAKSQQRFSRRRNFIYQRSILGNVKASLRAVEGLNDTEVKKIDSVKTLHDLDDTIVAPSIGLKSAEDYYETFSAINFLPKVQIPMFVSVAMDDHWLSPETYLDFDWSSHPNLTPAITNTGGHCGSHEQGYSSTWFDRQVLKFIKSVS